MAAQTFRAAFYRGVRPGWVGWYNRLIRARTRGRYSHVELQFSDGWSASSSMEDGGTRFKWIGYSSDHWDFIELPIEWEPLARAWFMQESQANRGYDYLGNLHIAFGFLKDSGGRHFCSEAVAAALGFDDAFRFEPNALFVVLRKAMEVYWQLKHQTIAVT